jgi:hypothetical protein
MSLPESWSKPAVKAELEIPGSPVSKVAIFLER